MSDQGENLHESTKRFRPNKFVRIFTIASMFIFMFVLIPWYAFLNDRFHPFTDQFTVLHEDSVTERGWIILAKDSAYWSRRTETPGMLTLFTLRGDTRPASSGGAEIRNLMLRKVKSDCFTAEIHFKDFVPLHNWQQAGIIFMEDAEFSGKSLRISLACNDSFADFTGPREILILVSASKGRNDPHPEEVAHLSLFQSGGETDFNKVKVDLENSALRVEKDGSTFRFLYRNANSGFQVVTTKEIEIEPEYAGVFALKGLVEEAEEIPVHINFFNYIPMPCD